jgi:DNA-binding beta-propeller fold protein YncE
VAVDANGKIYVTDSPDSTVFTYRPDGTPTSPTITAGLSSPYGITVDANGKIYVANAGGNNVTTYSKKGTQLKVTVACCENPRGVAVH